MDQRIEDILASAGVPNARLRDIRLYKKENTLAVTVECGVFLSYVQMERIKRALCGLMEGCRVEARFDTPSLQEAIKCDFESAVELLRRSLCEMAPTLSPMLEHSIWKKTEAGMEICVPAGISDGLTRNYGINEYLARLKKLYELDCAFTVRDDESIAAPKAAPKTAENIPVPKKPVQKKEKSASNMRVILGRAIKPGSVIPQNRVEEDSGRVAIRGSILSLETQQLKSGGYIVVAVITDRTNTLPVKLFLNANQTDVTQKLAECRDNGDVLIAEGRFSMDQWLKRMCVYPGNLCCVPAQRRLDGAEQKRVELHLHTQMSTMDALVKPEDAVNTAARWGHRAVAITDHGVVQAFPAAVKAGHKASKGLDEPLKVILGVEGYLSPDCELVDDKREYAVIAVTAAKAVKLDNIFEIAAVRLNMDGTEEAWSTVVDAGVPIGEEERRIGLDADAFSGAPTIREAIAQLDEFTAGRTKVLFDPASLRLLHEYASRYSMELDTRMVSLSMLAHYARRDIKNAKLETVLAAFGIDPCGGRAEETAHALAALAKKLIGGLPNDQGRPALPLIDCIPAERVKGRRSTYHIILLAKNRDGLKNLYRLVSYSHLEHLKKVPEIPRSLLAMHREGLIVGSACEAGELFRAVLDGCGEDELADIARMYDYLEIQPIANNSFLVRNERVSDDDGLRELNRRIVELGERLGKPVVATGDVHFLEPEDSVFRSILMSARDFKDAEQQAPLYFKTTGEMLEEFAYLGEEKAFETVVKNPNAIADMCEAMEPFLSEKSTYAPTIEGAAEELRTMAEARAHELYGETLPEPVSARLERELSSIIGNGYASLYLMAQRLVNKSLSDGYLVGSRGSVGSSFVATMAGITEVNPLPPHYVCPNCRYSQFDVDREKYACGVDMPDKDCPVCGKPLSKAGYEIPFEVFLGFKGDKTPDIDLNFSGEYQGQAHKFTEKMFGEGHAFRAGTISGIKDKTVYGYVRAYCENNDLHIGKDEMDRLVSGCTGVKRTTGQHPGGIVIVPAENDIMEFTPIQYPADNKDKNTVTTHFDFHAMDDRLVKLDILGHDDPTALRMLQDLTGVDPRSIPLDDKETMRLYSSSEPLGVSLEALDCDVGSIAIPEFGTGFVRQMLKDTRPTTMEELVRISGLSHGTDVWVGNAQDLVRGGVATLSEVICTRDDIMNYLIAKGGDPSLSFKTMESVRKGRGITEEMEKAMKAIRVPEWFIDSCKKIKYMFPRAHAAAYVMMGYRIAYYKLNYPAAFYAVYFTVRADAFDIAEAAGGAQRVLKNIMALKKKGNDIETKEAELLVILEAVYEMNLRGIELLPVDIYKSRAKEFTIENGAIRPPFSSISGVGESAAEGLFTGAAAGAYASVEDFAKRTGANSTAMKALEDMGCFEGMPKTNQISLFGI